MGDHSLEEDEDRSGEEGLVVDGPGQRRCCPQCKHGPLSVGLESTVYFVVAPGV